MVGNKSLVDRIADGEAILLDTNAVCKRIGISRTTFFRWLAGYGNTSFPMPDIKIGNSPKWDVETLKKWLISNGVAT